MNLDLSFIFFIYEWSTFLGPKTSVEMKTSFGETDNSHILHMTRSHNLRLLFS